MGTDCLRKLAAIHANLVSAKRRRTRQWCPKSAGGVNTVWCWTVKTQSHGQAEGLLSLPPLLNPTASGLRSHICKMGSQSHSCFFGCVQGQSIFRAGITSALQHGDSVIHTPTSILFQILFPHTLSQNTGEHRELYPITALILKSRGRENYMR